MYYIVKNKIENKYEVVEAQCHTSRAWYNAWGLDKHYEYFGINEDVGFFFDTREIIKKSRATTKQKVKMMYPEYFL